MTGIYQEMGEMIDDIKDKLTDNEYLVMYNKLRDMKKLHDKTVEDASTARLGRRWADSSSDSSSDSESDSDDTVVEFVPPLVEASEETIGQFRQDVDQWVTSITTEGSVPYRMRQARRAMNPRCRCGSPNHQRINHRLCPMNPSQTGNQRRIAPHRERGLGRSQRRRA
jgi:hypothetical protein